MAPLLSLLSWSTLAVLFASFAQSPVSAVSLHPHQARTSPNHGELARRMSEHKRVKRCKPRASVPAAPQSTSSDAPQPTSTSKPADHSDPAPAPAPAPPKTTSDKPKPSSHPPPAPSAGNPWSLCPNKKMLAWGAEAQFLHDWSQYAQRYNYLLFIYIYIFL
ncbi:MAG TPA: hypothetical protein VGO47_13940 [Chlamydiales bacterium]|nr:hypothetical protein [Chlamydiales bacterium]